MRPFVQFTLAASALLVAAHLCPVRQRCPRITELGKYCPLTTTARTSTKAEKSNDNDNETALRKL